MKVNQNRTKKIDHPISLYHYFSCCSIKPRVHFPFLQATNKIAELAEQQRLEQERIAKEAEAERLKKKQQREAEEAEEQRKRDEEEKKRQEERDRKRKELEAQQQKDLEKAEKRKKRAQKLMDEEPSDDVSTSESKVEPEVRTKSFFDMQGVWKI